MDNAARITQLQHFLESDPNDPHTHFLLGYEYLRAKDLDSAVRSFQKCVEADPDYAAAWKQLGDLFKRLKDKEKAIESYRNGVKAGEKRGEKHIARDCAAFLTRLES